MSLDWSTSDCATPEARSQHEAEERDRLVFASMAVGLSTLTRENEREWYVRILVCQELGLGEVAGRVPLGALERWIGLRTNVDDETRVEWKSRVVDAAFDRADCKADEIFGVVA